MPQFSDIVLGLIASGGGGALLTFMLHDSMEMRLRSDLLQSGSYDRGLRFPWLAAGVGITERTATTALMIFAPNLVVAFVGGWTALKMAGGWTQLFTAPNNRHARAAYSMALIGNVVSFGIAVLIGAMVNPGATEIISK